MSDDFLRRKLDLLLGSGPDWLYIYAGWAAYNDVGSTTELYADHNIQLFVKEQKRILAGGGLRP